MYAHVVTDAGGRFARPRSSFHIRQPLHLGDIAPELLQGAFDVTLEARLDPVESVS